MTAVTEAASAFTLDDAKASAAWLLLELADHLEPDTVGCMDCIRSTSDLCPDHGSERARQMVLEEAAKRVPDARDAVEVLSIMAAAAAEGGNR